MKHSERGLQFYDIKTTKTVKENERNKLFSTITGRPTTKYLHDRLLSARRAPAFVSKIAFCNARLLSCVSMKVD